MDELIGPRSPGDFRPQAMTVFKWIQELRAYEVPLSFHQERAGYAAYLQNLAGELEAHLTAYLEAKRRYDGRYASWDVYVSPLATRLHGRNLHLDPRPCRQPGA